MASDEGLRLIVFDIDGVLTDGEAQPWDLALMRDLAALNRAARQDGRRPAVTVCTGRPAPYVDAILQAIDGHVPGVFEGGAGLYVPAGYRFLPHPLLGDGGDLQRVKQCLANTLVRSGQAYFQPGKEFSASLFPTDGTRLESLRPLALDALGPLSARVDLVYSASCLNVMPKGIDKAVGLHFLAQITGIAPGDMLAVGDSEVDLPLLQAAGFSAAPANASPEIKGVAHYVSSLPTASGVRDVLVQYGFL